MCCKTQWQGQELGSGARTDATRSFQNTSSKSMSCRPGAGCVAEDVCGHAPEKPGIERVAECTFFGGRLAVVVSVSRQWRNVQDFPQMQHERSMQLVLFGSASRRAESTDILEAACLLPYESGRSSGNIRSTRL